MSQLRFQWRSTLAGENGRLFGTAALAPLERPGDMTRTEMLYTAELAQYRSPATRSFI